MSSASEPSEEDSERRRVGRTVRHPSRKRTTHASWGFESLTLLGEGRDEEAESREPVVDILFYCPPSIALPCGPTGLSEGWRSGLTRRGANAEGAD